MSGQVPEEIINAMHSTMAQCTIAAQIARQNYERWYNQAVHVGSYHNRAVHIGGGVMLHPGVGIITAPPAVLADPVPTPRPVPLVTLLNRIAFFIPKSIREPFFGDLREDLEHMAAMGYSPATVWYAAVSQFAVLALRWAWSSRRRG